MQELKQIGALPLRLTANGELEALLVTTRETERWVIPKGWPVKKLSDRLAAGREALEEAGVSGILPRRPIGTYSYFKRMQKSFELVEVCVYTMWVNEIHATWPEMAERERCWFSVREADEMIIEPGLRSILRRVTVASAGLTKPRRRSQREAPSPITTPNFMRMT